MSSETLNGNTMSEYGPSGRIPASPFEIQATKALLNKRIEAGSIALPHPLATPLTLYR